MWKIIKKLAYDIDIKMK